MRNHYDDIQKEELAKNRIHNGRMLESKAREFNILNAHNYDSARTERMYGKKMDQSGYDLKSYVRAPSPIRQSGFSTIL